MFISQIFRLGYFLSSIAGIFFRVRRCFFFQVAKRFRLLNEMLKKVISC